MGKTHCHDPTVMVADSCCRTHSVLSSFPMATKRPIGRERGVTLRDVVVHMQHMEQRLSKDISTNTAAIQKVERRLTNVETGLTGVGSRLNEVEERLTARIDALEEDLTATIRDTIKIRQHVGMAVPEDE